jgi:hypothetical protein
MISYFSAFDGNLEYLYSVREGFDKKVAIWPYLKVKTAYSDEIASLLFLAFKINRFYLSR